MTPRGSLDLEGGVRKRIRQLRHRRDLTSEQVAKRARISRPYYTQIEGGTRRLGVRYLYRIAFALSVDPRDLL